ncbi:MIM family subclass B3 metallo-beta-lactamase [Novosphingobium pentaromativorans]|uniref:Beta-lactamase-like protein n=2 Tax=Novosphingobium pentaromativorans TaxID=205844 RepID=G6EHN2_9SPHN|nr:subclass B3 metallo-beta-lactamase [Novosphingobium pentaromativorans]EHJ59192.1 beta-lactamase-like protein [Novosphingobium pentaromativorans US6-1]
MSRIVKNMVLAALIAATPPSIAQARDSAAKAAPTTLATACKGLDGREGWSHPAPPAHIYGNTWYVGTCGIASILVTSDDGHVLIDSGPADAAPLVLANIRKLGFDPADVRWILTSHEHHDHAGSIAELQKATGAQIAAVASARQVLESGKPSADDPQSGLIEGFPPVHVARVLVDGDSVTLGRLALTVRETPAHSPGSASWTWQACDEAFTCRMIAYADSATTISADDYRFSDHPDRIARIRTGLSRIAQLPCDILVTPHPSASNLFDRLSGKAPLVNAQACAAYSQAAGSYFAKRLAEEAGEAAQ